jgi:colanic acid biosynthesis glycosyl transferase WcaI
MKILIYGMNYSPELTGVGKYTGEMATWLAARGHQVKVVTAPPYYPEWSFWKGYKNFYSRDKVDNVDVIRCPLYMPAKPTALKRLVHLLSFSLMSLLPVLALGFWKPNVVIQVVPTLFCSIQALVISRLSGAKSIVHIQDFEIDAMFGLSMLKGGLFKRLTLSLERLILNRFDIISTISKGMMNRARDKGISDEKIVHFPNWSDIRHFSKAEYNEKYLLKIRVDVNKKLVLYSGNLGEKQGLESVVHTAASMKLNTDIHFLIVGEGAAKERLIKLARSLSLDNITFLPLQSYEDLPSLLSSCHCHLVVQKSGVADSVMPSKLINILAVGGNAVITADKDTTLGDLCGEFQGIATLVEPESVDGLKAGILKSISLARPNLVAKNYARDYLEKDTILGQFISDISKTT